MLIILIKKNWRMSDPVILFGSGYKGNEVSEEYILDLKLWIQNKILTNLS